MFIGLWNFADDAGRHPASTKQIKAEIFPADDFTLDDIQGYVDELEQNRLIELYTVENKQYLRILGWHHQRIDKPQDPKYPEPLPEHSTNDPRTIPPDSKGYDSKGKEGKGKDSKGKDSTGAKARSRGNGKAEPITNETWAAYAASYLQRYGVEPVRNASVNGKLAKFIERVGIENAPHIAAYFVGLNTKWYVTKGHAVGVMLNDAEKLATEWRTNSTVTETEARQGDQRQAQAGVWQRLLDEERSKHGEH